MAAGKVGKIARKWVVENFEKSPIHHGELRVYLAFRGTGRTFWPWKSRLPVLRTLIPPRGPKKRTEKNRLEIPVFELQRWRFLFDSEGLTEPFGFGESLW